MLALAAGLAIVAGIVWRVVVSGDHVPFGEGDQKSYSTLARSIADHLTYVIPGATDTYRWAPVAPFAFAAGLKVLGGGGSGLFGAYVVQLLISIATLGALALVVRRFAGPALALLACAVLALSTGTVIAAGDLITEPVGALLLLVAVALLGVGLERPAEGRRWLAPFLAGGFALGVANLARPDFLPFAIVAAAVALLVWTVPWRARGLAAACVVVMWALAMAPWCVKATQSAGHTAIPTTSAATTLWVGTYLPGNGTVFGVRKKLAAQTRRVYPSIAADRLPPAVLTAHAVAKLRHPELSTDAALKLEGRANLRKYALGDPVSFAGMEVGKVWRMWSRPYAGQRKRSLAGNLLHIPGALAALIAIGGAALLRRRRPALVLVALVLIAGTGMNVVAVTQPRSAVRYLPVALLGAAMTAQELVRRRAAARAGAQPGSDNPDSSIQPRVPLGV